MLCRRLHVGQRILSKTIISSIVMISNVQNMQYNIGVLTVILKGSCLIILNEWADR